MIILQNRKSFDFFKENKFTLTFDSLFKLLQEIHPSSSGLSTEFDLFEVNSIDSVLERVPNLNVKSIAFSPNITLIKNKFEEILHASTREVPKSTGSNSNMLSNSMLQNVPVDILSKTSTFNAFQEDINWLKEKKLKN